MLSTAIGEDDKGMLSYIFVMMPLRKFRLPSQRVCLANRISGPADMHDGPGESPGRAHC